MQAYPRFSCMSEKPGPLVAVILFTPAREAPTTAPMLAISSSIWIKVPSTSGSRDDMRSMISEAGVIGYPAKKRQPAAMAPSAMASLPCSSRGLFSSTLGTIGLPSSVRVAIENGYSEIRAVEFTETAAGAGIWILYDRPALFVLVKHSGRAECNTYAASLAPVLENFLLEKFFSFSFKLFLGFPVVVWLRCFLGWIVFSYYP